jgi:D-alanyl-D-alanine carboxypeptidase
MGSERPRMPRVREERRAIAASESPRHPSRTAAIQLMVGEGGTSAAAAGAVIELQRRAGNQAVTGLVRPRPRVQRFPEASTGSVDGATAEIVGANLDVATRDLGQDGWLAGQLGAARTGAGTARTDAPALTPAVLLERVWRLPLREGDVPAALRQRYSRFRTRLVTAVAALHQSLWSSAGALIAAPDAQASLRQIVDGLHAAGPSFDVFATAVDLWEHWLRLCPPESVGVDQFSASRMRLPLRAALAAQVEQWADTFSGTPHDKHTRPGSVAVQTDPTGAELNAVAAAIRGRDTWVQNPDVPAVAGTVAGTLSRPVAEVTAALPRWLIHAECRLIGEAHLDQPSPAVWAFARSVYVSTIDQPIWRYFDENVVQFELFGHQIWGKRAGVHKAVVPMLRLVEQEAMRLAGTATVQGLKFSPGEWGGFRFEPQKADLAAKSHVSFHATGTAIDFRVKTNDAITGRASDLLDLIAHAAGSASTTAGISHDDTPATQAQTSWSNEVMSHTRRRDELRAQLEAARPASSGADGGQAPAQPDPQVADLERQLAAEETWLRTVGQQQHADELRQSGETIRTHLEAVEQALQRSFSTHFPAQPPVPETETPRQRQARQAARAQELAKGWPALREDIRATLDDRAARAFDRAFPVSPAPTGVLQALDHVSEVGITDQPAWMVQAFTSLGWRWGGGWHDPVDAMHFDFMGDIPGVHH